MGHGKGPVPTGMYICICTCHDQLRCGPLYHCVKYVLHTCMPEVLMNAVWFERRQNKGCPPVALQVTYESLDILALRCARHW